MAESDLWSTLKHHTQRHGHIERVENMAGIGRPDVNYCIRGVEGNIELKQLPEWPKREDTVVPVRHFTPQQRLWIRDRVRAGGRVYVLLQVCRPANLYMLLPGEWARTSLGLFATQQQIIAAAIVRGATFPAADLLKVITGAD
jgi:hypothetical protein